MDPKACLERIVTALEHRESAEAREAIKDLQQWLRRGGFAPRVDGTTLDFLLGVIADGLN